MINVPKERQRILQKLGYQTYAEAAKMAGIPSDTMWNRVDRCAKGYITLKDVMRSSLPQGFRFKESRCEREYGFKLTEKAKELGMKKSTLYSRLDRVRFGEISLEEALYPGKYKTGPPKGTVTVKGARGGNDEWKALGD